MLRGLVLKVQPGQLVRLVPLGVLQDQPVLLVLIVL
jgi:hypothetical protein